MTIFLTTELDDRRRAYSAAEFLRRQNKRDAQVAEESTSESNASALDKLGAGLTDLQVSKRTAATIDRNNMNSTRDADPCQ